MIEGLEDLNNLVLNYPQAETRATLVITQLQQVRETKIRHVH